MAASDDVTAAAAAMVSAANAIGAVAADLQSAEANIKTQIGALEAQIASLGTPRQYCGAERCGRGHVRADRRVQAAQPGGGRARDPAPGSSRAAGRELTPRRYASRWLHGNAGLSWSFGTGRARRFVVFPRGYHPGA